MIKLKDFVLEKRGEDGKRYMRCALAADTDAEVRAQGTTGEGIVGMSGNDIITEFSTAFTADKQLLILDSNGIWQ